MGIQCLSLAIQDWTCCLEHLHRQWCSLVEQIGGGLLIANHLDQSLWWANQKHWVAIRSYLLHSFLQVHRAAAAPFTSHGNLHNYAEPNHFPEPNQQQHMLDFLHPILLCRITYRAPLEMLLGRFLRSYVGLKMSR